MHVYVCVKQKRKQKVWTDRQTKNNSSHIVYLIHRISIELGIVPWTSSGEVIKK